jgi:HPt (histidine-containing phosphotransfer) domain-containing protein
LILFLPSFRKLLKNFAEKWSELPQKMHKALDSGNMEQLRIMPHSLKGIAGNLSALELEKAAKELELYFKENDNLLNISGSKAETKINDKMNNVENALARVLKSIRNLEISGEDSPEIPGSKDKGGQPDLSEISPILIKLSKSLAANRADAEDIMDSVIDRLSNPLVEKECRQLESQVRMYDFKGAQKTLKIIAGILDL